MAKLIIPLTAFILPMKKQGKMRLVKMTLNNWIMIHGMRAGRMIANKRKHQIQAKIMPLVDQAMVDGLDPIGANTKFKFEWYFPDRRTDLDNWTLHISSFLTPFRQVQSVDRYLCQTII